MPITARKDIRNVALIAHIDHGKTTLVDSLLKQSNIFASYEQVGELILDSNELEREKGITILAKNTAIQYKGVTINLIDTPGHVDFGGEVERVLSMADGCLLLVDAAEGPMPQTRAVLKQALALGLHLIIVINKLDKKNAAPVWALEATHDLMLEVATEPHQLDAPVLYTNGRQGTATTDLKVPGVNLEPLLDAVLDFIPIPVGLEEAGLQLLVSSLDDNSYRGRLALGRIRRGTIRKGQEVVVSAMTGWTGRQTITGILKWQGLRQIEVLEATIGDIVAVFGLPEVNIGDTICSLENPLALPRIEVGEPTLKMQFSVNKAPFAGTEQKLSSTSRQILGRLDKELRTNMALRVGPGNGADNFEVSGRGELHLAILIETMRREGYEFEVSRPQVITRERNGIKTEPVEECIIDVQQEYMGSVTELMGGRGAIVQSMRTDAGGGIRITYHAPTRALIGARSALLTQTRGTGVMATNIIGWETWRALPRPHRNGALVATQPGTAVAYGLQTLQERGQPFIKPGTPVYEGMIVGLNRRPGDLGVNVTKQKQKTNVRSSTSDFTIVLTPAKQLSLEEALDFILDDELVEVTPLNLRLRKRILDTGKRSAVKKREISEEPL